MLSRLLPVLVGLGAFVIVGASLHHRSAVTEVGVEGRDLGGERARPANLVEPGTGMRGAAVVGDSPAVAATVEPAISRAEALPPESGFDSADDEEVAGEPGPAAYTARSYYGKRFDNVRSAAVGDLREALSEALCSRHPDACRALAAAADEELVGEVLGVPSAEDLAALESEEAAAIFARMESLSAAFDEVDEYYFEVWATKGPGNTVDVETWLGGDYRGRMGELVDDLDGWMQAVNAYGSIINTDHDPLQRTEGAAPLLEILWRERCALEEHLAELDDDLALWIHLSRSATTHIWDGSYWIPPDEEVQFLFPFPVHID